MQRYKGLNNRGNASLFFSVKFPTAQGIYMYEIKCSTLSNFSVWNYIVELEGTTHIIIHNDEFF